MKVYVVVFALLSSICFAPRVLLGQASGLGSMAGAVEDNSQAVVPGATIQVTNSAGATRTVKTDDRGEFQIVGLEPGTYTVTASATGFKDFVAPKVIVIAGQTARVAATVVLAGITSSIDVQSQAATQVETESAELTGTITPQEIGTLALNGRNFAQLVALTPGVSNQTGQDEAQVGAKGSAKYSVNGGRVEYNSYEVDGGDILDTSLNGNTSTLAVYPSLDAIGDMKVLTSNYGAMYGRSASGIIQASIKPGTSQLHGDAYLFARNNIFNARNFFDHTTSAPLYQEYDPGFTIGGPVYIPGVYNTNKDKTFFFWSEEYRHDRDPTNNEFNQGVPSAAERDCSQAKLADFNGGPNPFCASAIASHAANPNAPLYGDFSDACPTLPASQLVASGASPGDAAYFVRDPNSPEIGKTAPDGITKIAYAPDCPGRPASFGVSGLFVGFNGNMVPINPVSNAILSTGLIPEPNSTSGCNSSYLVGTKSSPSAPLSLNSTSQCYNSIVSPLTTWREDLFRIDHNFSSKEKIYFHYIHDSWNTVNTIPEWAYVHNSFPTVENDFTSPGLSLVAHLTSVISNTFVNDVAMSFTVNHISLTDIPGQGVTSLSRPDLLNNPPCAKPDGSVCAASGAATLQSGLGYLFPSANKGGGKLPGIIIAGTNTAYGGTGFSVDPGYMPWHFSNPNYNILDDATWIHGKHTISFGAQFIIAQRNEINPPVGANIGDMQGLATFSNINNNNTTGNSFADFLTPNIQSFQQDSGQSDYHNNFRIAETYVQDDWKLTSRITFNLGLRLSLFGTFYEKYLHSYNFVPTLYDLSAASQQTIDPATGILLSGGKPVPIYTSNGAVNPVLTNGLEQCGAKGVPASCMTNRLFNPAPRVGFAWDPTGSGKTSIRGGYGVFYEHGTANEANTGSLEGSPGQGGVLDMTQYYPASWGCIGSVPGSDCQPNTQGLGSLPAFPLNVTSIPTKNVWPYVQQWSASVQRELPWKMLGTAAYVGSAGRNLSVELQINQLPPLPATENPFATGQPLTNDICASVGLGAFQIPVPGTTNQFTSIAPTNPAFVYLQMACTGVNTQLPVPNSLRGAGGAIAPGLGQIFSLQNIAHSRYNAFQATLRRADGPVEFGISYSFSHSTDDASDRSSANFINAYDINQNWANSDFDQRHLLSVTYVAQLPVRRALGYLFAPIHRDPNSAEDVFIQNNPNWGKGYLDGWELSGIVVYSSGTPFTVLNGGSPNGISSLDNAGVAAVLGPGAYPDLATSATGNSTTSTITVPSGFSIVGPVLGNPMQFVAPQGLTYGTSGRNYLNNPSRLNFDTTLTKTIKLGESKTLQFRVESYNTFNHTQFEVYDRNHPGQPGNNVVTCYNSSTLSSADTACVASNGIVTSFLHPVEAHRSRTMQFGVKFLF